MPYFVILPIFAGLLCAEGLVLAACAAIPRLRAALPYAWRVLIGSGAGFCCANAASLLFGLVPVACAAALGIGADDPAAQVVAAFALLGLFFGPLIASPLGFLCGAWLGLRRARRARPATT
jgi:hypothetical protein